MTLPLTGWTVAMGPAGARAAAYRPLDAVAGRDRLDHRPARQLIGARVQGQTLPDRQAALQLAVVIDPQGRLSGRALLGPELGPMAYLGRVCAVEFPVEARIRGR